MRTFQAGTNAPPRAAAEPPSLCVPSADVPGRRWRSRRPSGHAALLSIARTTRRRRRASRRPPRRQRGAGPSTKRRGYGASRRGSMTAPDAIEGPVSHVQRAQLMEKAAAVGRGDDDSLSSSFGDTAPPPRAMGLPPAGPTPSEPPPISATAGRRPASRRAARRCRSARGAARHAVRAATASGCTSPMPLPTAVAFCSPPSRARAFLAQLLLRANRTAASMPACGTSAPLTASTGNSHAAMTTTTTRRTRRSSRASSAVATADRGQVVPDCQLPGLHK